MYTENTEIGETIKSLRKLRGISRNELAEKVDISVSHLEKIETGARKPGMATYQKIMTELKMDMVIRNENGTIQEKCAARIERIVLNSSAGQAQFLASIVESMAENMGLVL